MATFTASVPLNLAYRGPSGHLYELARGDRYAREPIPAGSEFTIGVEADAEAFLAAYGPQPAPDSPPRRGVERGETVDGRIPGLVRID